MDARTRDRYRRECVQPCKEIRYRATVSYSDLDSEQIGVVLGQSKQFIDNHDYYKIHLYYQELLYTSIEELNILKFETIVTGFGGLLSLYLGANLVNLSRAIVFLVRKISKNPTQHIIRKTAVYTKKHSNSSNL